MRKQNLFYYVILQINLLIYKYYIYIQIITFMGVVLVELSTVFEHDGLGLGSITVSNSTTSSSLVISIASLALFTFDDCLLHS